MRRKKKIERVIKKIFSFFKAKNTIPIPNIVDSKEMLKDKIALITGGSSGIGKAISQSFIKSGCKIIIAGRNEDNLKKCVSELGENANYICLDATKVDTFETKIEEAAAFWGRIDILVNSAGVLSHHEFFDVTEEEYDTVMNTNAKGTYFLSQKIGKYMIENKIKGHILNISSSSSLRPAWTPYQVSKHAVKGMTLGMADMLIPYGIVVNSLAPGPVATPMLEIEEGDSIYKYGHPSERYAMPSEIADMVVILVSDLGNLVVGDTLYMTGGSGVITLHE